MPALNYTLATLAAVALVGTASAQNYTTTFIFDPASDIIGQITLDSGLSGPIVASDIISFDFTSAPGLNGLLSGMSATCMTGCGLSVSGENLLWITPPGNAGLENLDGNYYGVTFDQGGSGPQYHQSNFILTDAVANGVPMDELNDAASGSVFASAPSSMAAPEIGPSSAISALTLLLGGLAMMRGARRSR